MGYEILELEMVDEFRSLSNLCRCSVEKAYKKTLGDTALLGTPYLLLECKDPWTKICIVVPLDYAYDGNAKHHNFLFDLDGNIILSGTSILYRLANTASSD